jgi:prohibitin 1
MRGVKFLKERGASALHKVRRYRKEHWAGLAIGALILVFALAYFSDRMLISVYPGEGMVVYHRFGGGTVSDDVFYEGFHFVAPWNKVYRYDLTLQRITLPLTVLSNEGLEIHLDVSAAYRANPDLLPHLARRFGPAYAQKAVIPGITQAVQDIVGKLKAADIYSLSRKDSHDRLFSISRQDIGGVYVLVDEISLLNIRLPDRVQEAIQRKLEEEQLAELYNFRLVTERMEALRKQEEAVGIRNFQRIVSGGISNKLLVWKGIEATQDLAKSPNAKIVVFGNDRTGLPLVMGGIDTSKPAAGSTSQ